MADRELIRIDTQGTLAAVLAAMAEQPMGIERARRRALSKLATWAKRQVLREASAASGASQKKLQALVRYRTTQRGDGALSIWIGTDPIAAHHLGTVRWNRRMVGARVGKRSYPGTWSWGEGSRTGPAVMRRTGDGRLPIEVERVPIHDAVRARVDALVPTISDRLERLMIQELNYVLNIERKRAA